MLLKRGLTVKRLAASGAEKCLLFGVSHHVRGNLMALRELPATSGALERFEAGVGQHMFLKISRLGEGAPA